MTYFISKFIYFKFPDDLDKFKDCTIFPNIFKHRNLPQKALKSAKLFFGAFGVKTIEFHQLFLKIGRDWGSLEGYISIVLAHILYQIDLSLNPSPQEPIRKIYSRDVTGIVFKES